MSAWYQFWRTFFCMLVLKIDNNALASQSIPYESIPTSLAVRPFANGSNASTLTGITLSGVPSSPVPDSSSGNRDQETAASNGCGIKVPGMSIYYWGPDDAQETKTTQPDRNTRGTRVSTLVLTTAGRHVSGTWLPMTSSTVL